MGASRTELLAAAVWCAIEKACLRKLLQAPTLYYDSSREVKIVSFIVLGTAGVFVDDRG
jgi:hypothetical protein